MRLRGVLFGLFELRPHLPSLAPPHTLTHSTIPPQVEEIALMAITTTREDGRRLYIPTSKLMIDITVNLSRYVGGLPLSVY